MADELVCIAGIFDASHTEIMSNEQASTSTRKVGECGVSFSFGGTASNTLR